MKIKKKFLYKGIEIRIVERQEPYLNTTGTFTRVLAPNDGIIPVNLVYKQTLKSIVQTTIDLLESFEKSGADITKELTRKI